MAAEELRELGDRGPRSFLSSVSGRFRLFTRRFSKKAEPRKEALSILWPRSEAPSGRVDMRLLDFMNVVVEENERRGGGVWRRRDAHASSLSR